ncbi:hypothetical protein NP233_g10365 [Leucocoprinus birnbaumii]|uniref:Uncharacterized protein n=1 Tax=Leucocoprinus birnbaumii TaxID=56174 RepID=A0AAD5VPE6_9AGAR|nr:hypothetical protein NP233_g10365 [Leucocoprinus birnbaumii]
MMTSTPQISNGVAETSVELTSLPPVVGINFGNSYASIAVFTKVGLLAGSLRSLSQRSTSAPVIQHPDLADTPAYKVTVFQPAPTPLPPGSTVTSNFNTPAASALPTPHSGLIQVDRYLTPDKVTTIFLCSLVSSAEVFSGSWQSDLWLYVLECITIRGRLVLSRWHEVYIGAIYTSFTDEYALVIVSHNSGCLYKNITDILHLDNLKPHRYRDNLDAFFKAARGPKSYCTFEVAEDNNFKLPDTFCSWESRPWRSCSLRCARSAFSILAPSFSSSTTSLLDSRFPPKLPSLVPTIPHFYSHISIQN